MRRFRVIAHAPTGDTPVEGLTADLAVHQVQYFVNRGLSVTIEHDGSIIGHSELARLAKQEQDAQRS